MTYLESQSHLRYRLSRKFLWGTLIGFVVAILIGVYCVGDSDVVALRKSYASICMIRAGANTGTGVLLDTGYILTAAHTLDRNRDMRVSNGERSVKVSFGDDISDRHRGRVIYFDMRMDFAFVEIFDGEEHLGDGVSITLVNPDLADRIYAIGCTNGQPPILSEGRTSYDVGRLGRASCFVYSGNSGGPILNENHEVFGVVVGMGFSAKTDRFVVPTGEKGEFRVGSVTRIEPISGICYYVKTEDIYVKLLSKNIQSLLVKEPELLIHDPRYHYAIGLLESIIGIQIFLMFVYSIREHLFGSQVR